MRSRCAIAVICLVLGAYGQALAHGKEKPGKAAPADAQMKKMHDMMPMFSLASARLETSLEKGNTAAVESEAGKMLAAIPDLKKSKPHKNIKQRKEFVELATKMERNLISTVELAKSGDLAGAKTAFKKVEEICAACHAKFR
jgi:soluble cytochrome b562